MSPTRWHRTHYWARVVVRLFLAFVFLSYAVAKLVGTQFINRGPTMEKPVGELSGFEFTWAYFGYSTLFSWFVAGGQLTAAVLLLFDRTTRLGTAILLPIVANIVVVNFAFNISHDTKIVSVLYLGLTVFLILGDWRAWKRVLWDEPAMNPNRPVFVRRRWITAVKLLLFCAVGIGGWFFLDGLQKSFVPVTPLTGDWSIESYLVNGQPVQIDPALPQWRRLCADGEDITIVTDRGLLYGRIQSISDGQLIIGYDPVVPDPPSPKEIAEAQKALEMSIKEYREAAKNRVWPETITGTYRREASKMIVTGTRRGQVVELVLRPLVRQKY